jgi:hypothetical protein
MQVKVECSSRQYMFAALQSAAYTSSSLQRARHPQLQSPLLALADAFCPVLLRKPSGSKRLPIIPVLHTF